MNLLIADETFNNSVASVVGYDEVQNLTTVALDPITLHLGENMYYGLPKTIALTQGASTLVIHMEDREDPKEIKEPGRGPISAYVLLFFKSISSSNTKQRGKRPLPLGAVWQGYLQRPRHHNQIRRWPEHHLYRLQFRQRSSY